MTVPETNKKKLGSVNLEDWSFLNWGPLCHLANVMLV